MKRLIYCLFMLSLLVSCSEQAQRVYGRYVPERKDDFAWENEYAAYRMYGPALAAENPSNGVDLWLKQSPELIVDTFYYNDLTLGKPYHVYHGKGLDCYKVGHTMGCGGLAVVVGNEVYVGGPYSSWTILEQTKTKLVFSLHYDSLLVAGRKLKEDITITCLSGQRLNKAQVVIYDPAGEEEIEGLQVGGGIYLHDAVDNLTFVPEQGLVTYAEEAWSDKMAEQMNREAGFETMGRSYVAIVVPGATRLDTLAGNALALREYHLGDTLTYYFGGGWSNWSDGEQTQTKDEDWLAFMSSLNNKQ